MMGEQSEELVQRSKGEIRRQELVLAAYHLLTERGFEGLRVREVASSVGITIATFHYYFPTKDDLVHAIGEHLAWQFQEVVAPLPEDYRGTPEQQILQVFRNKQYQLEQAPHLFIVFHEFHLHARRDRSVQRVLQRLDDAWRAHLVAICTAGIQQQVFRADLDVPWFVSTIIALLHGISLQLESHLDTFDLERLGTQTLAWLTGQ
jgi:AcrR family transcriptional regulator